MLVTGCAVIRLGSNLGESDDSPDGALYISGYCSDGAVLEGNDLQNESFLQKPFSMDVLERQGTGHAELKAANKRRGWA
jgi:hypothetical protein